MKVELQKLITDVRGKIKVHGSLKYAVRKLTDITSIGIHHSATTAGSAASFATYHVDTNGWPGIGYTYVINKNGAIEWCNSWETTSYHVGNSNKGSLGICIVGDFTKEKPTKEQLNSAYLLIEYITGEIKSAAAIKGHCEYSGYATKACPSFSMTEFRSNYSGWLKAQTSTPAPALPSVTTADKRDIVIKVSGETIIANGLFSEGTNYVPIRVLSLFDFVVGWDAADKTITLITPKERDMLYQIVQAEAGGEDAKGRILVANVIMNRVKSPGYPNSINEVIFQPSQFEPTRNGAYEKAAASDSTKAAVDCALAGADYSLGALYFIANKSVPGSWHDTNLKLLFTHGGHTFYTNK